MHGARRVVPDGPWWSTCRCTVLHARGAVTDTRRPLCQNERQAPFSLPFPKDPPHPSPCSPSRGLNGGPPPPPHPQPVPTNTLAQHHLSSLNKGHLPRTHSKALLLATHSRLARLRVAPCPLVCTVHGVPSSSRRAQRGRQARRVVHRASRRPVLQTTTSPLPLART
jgi:hypothetical protein